MGQLESLSANSLSVDMPALTNPTETGNRLLLLILLSYKCCQQMHIKGKQLSFIFMATLWPMEVPGPGMEPVPPLHPSCGNTRSVTHCARPGMETGAHRDKPHGCPLCHRGDSLFIFLKIQKLWSVCVLFRTSLSTPTPR